MKLKPLLISLAAVSALAAGAANAAQVIVTTGAGYVKMVDALAALYQKETGVAVEKSFGGNIGQMLAQMKHGSGVNVVISDEASLEKFHDALAPDARRLGDTPLVLVWRKGLAPRVLGFVITIPLVFPPVALGYMLLTALGRTSLVGGALEPFGLSLIFNARPSRSQASLRAYRSSFVRFRQRSPRRASSNSRRPSASTARAGATSSSGSRYRSFGRVSRRRSFSAAPRLGRGGHHHDARRQHLGTHQHALARNLQRRLTRRLRRRERALPPALALCGRHLPCGRAPHQAQPKALTSNARVTRETLRLDSSEMADRVKWKDYPILLNYPP